MEAILVGLQLVVHMKASHIILESDLANVVAMVNDEFI